MTRIARIVAACLLAQMILSPALWLGDAWIAPLPALSWSMPLAVARVLGVVLAIAALLVLAGVRTRVTWPMLFAAILLRAAPDRALWQAYVLEHAVIAGALAWASRDAVARELEARAAVRWTIGLVFLWGGLHKLNPSFLSEEGMIFLGFESPFASAAVALFEVLAGAALFVARTRRAAALVLVIFSIVVAIGLIALGHNRAVVPWNLEHAAILAVLLRAKDGEPRPRAIRVAIAVVLGLLPSAYPLGWPPYLSLRLYTASSLEARVYVHHPRALPAPARAVAERDASETFAVSIDVQAWAHEACGAFVPPDEPSFRAILGRVCARDRRALLVLSSPREWWAEPHTRYVRCSDL